MLFRSHEKAPAPAKHGAEPAKHGAEKPAAEKPEVPPPPPPEPSGPPPVSESEKALLLELRKRREDLEKRDASVAEREAALAAAERKISGRAEELRTLQGQMGEQDATRRQKDEENWRGLAKLYEAMKPREAAAIFNDLPMPVLLPLISKIKEAKAAPILAAMPDRKSTRLNSSH